MLLKQSESAWEISAFGAHLDEMDEMNAEVVKVCELLDAITLHLPAYKYFKRITEVIEAVDDETPLSVYWNWDRVIIRDVKELVAQLDEAIRLGDPTIWRSTHWFVVDLLVKHQLGIRDLIYEDEDGELVGPPRPGEEIYDLPGRSSGETEEAAITFHCDFLVDYRADDKKAAGVIGWALLMVYQPEGDNYRYREFQLTGDVARLILEQYLVSQDPTDRLGHQASHRTKFRYTGNIATNLLKWAELDARFVFDADNSSIVPIKEACLPHPGFQNGMPLHPQFVYLDEGAGWRAFLGCDGSGGIV